MGRDAAGATTSLTERRTRRVLEAFAELPSRCLGAAPDYRATFQIRLSDVGRTWEVCVHGARCEVHPSPTRRPGVVIVTDVFLWGDSDRLIPSGFARHVAEALPSADQEVLPDCGHVPQVEFAERTNGLIRGHILAAAAAAPAAPARHLDAWAARSPRLESRHG